MLLLDLQNLFHTISILLLPLVQMCHSRTLNNKINKLHEKALFMTIGSRRKQSETMHHRNFLVLLVQNAGCIFTYFCDGHKNNLRSQLRSSFNIVKSNVELWKPENCPYRMCKTSLIFTCNKICGSFTYNFLSSCCDTQNCAKMYLLRIFDTIQSCFKICLYNLGHVSFPFIKYRFLVKTTF